MKIFKVYWVSRIEIIKNLIEILAILVGGGWVYFTFSIKDSPSLFRESYCKADITIDSIDPKLVRLELITEFRNPGKRRLYLDSTRVKYWLISLDSIKNLTYFSVDSFINHTSPTKKLPNDTSLSGEYLIDQAYTQAFNFFLKKDSVKMVALKVNFYYEVKHGFFYSKLDSTSYYDYRIRCLPDER
jgi:hypothetical protein